MRYEPGVNAAASPYRFELQMPDPEIWFLEDDGLELGIFHSHRLVAAAAVAHRCREHRALAGTPVPDLHGAHGRARRLADRVQGNRADPARPVTGQVSDAET